MDKSDLENKINSLPARDKCLFYKRFTDLLNDRYSCYVYGGVTSKEYATLPKEKLKRIVINLYNEMFERIKPPMRIIIDYSSLNKNLEKLDTKLAKLSKNCADEFCIPCRKNTPSLIYTN